MRYTLHLATFPQLPTRAERLMHSVLLDHPLPEAIRKRVCWSWRAEAGNIFIEFFVDGNPVIVSRLVPGEDDMTHIARTAKFITRSVVTYCFIYPNPRPRAVDPDDTVCTDHN